MICDSITLEELTKESFVGAYRKLFGNKFSVSYLEVFWEEARIRQEIWLFDSKFGLTRG